MIDGGGLLGERPVVPGGRERTERKEQLQCQIEGDAAQEPVVKAKKAPSAPSLDEWDGHLAAGHAGHRGWCPFCVAGWLITHLVPCRGTQHRWIIGKLVNDVIMSGVQTLVVKSDQEASIVDVKNALMRELRCVEGLTVVPKESPVGGSAANAALERSVWEMQSIRRALVAYAEWVHGTVFEPGSAILTWAVEFPGQVVSRFQRSVSDGKTAYKRRKLKSYRKALVPFGELVMFMPMEKPKDMGEVGNCVGIMLGLVDRSDEVVIGTTEQVVKARTVHRMPVGQRGDAAYAKSMQLRASRWAWLMLVL